MKTEGRALRVFVYVNQTRGLGTINFRNCDVLIKEERVELVLDQPQVIVPSVLVREPSRPLVRLQRRETAALPIEGC